MKKKRNTEKLRNLYSFPDITHKIKKDNEMGCAFSTYRSDDKCIQRFGKKKLNDVDYLSDQRLHGRIKGNMS